MEEHIEKQDIPLIDARFPDVFKNGHIPTSHNLPFNKLLTQDGGKFRPQEELK
jgi:3-mercaptopyruvate sulfurtransferase SseA